MRSPGYGQFCGVAAALDVVGDRWALLVVRELLDGPHRYTDLRRGLPGISTDMLARRLADLEAHGVVRRVGGPRPTAHRRYELTERGRELEAVVEALARFGLRELVKDDQGRHAWDPRWMRLAARAAFDATAAPRRAVVVRFEIGSDALTVAINRRGIEFVPDAAGGSATGTAPADVVLRSTARTFVRILGDPDGVPACVADGSLEVSGSPAAVGAAMAAFGLGPVSRGA